MGQRLARRGFKAGLIVSSPAQRALVTSRYIANEIGYPLDQIIEERDFYLAAPDTIIERLRLIPPDRADTVMVFGHNPTFTMLANTLGDLSVDNMPTCAMAVFDFPIERWSDLDYGKGTLDFFDYPKNNPEL